jgi:hypothetical protein
MKDGYQNNMFEIKTILKPKMNSEIFMRLINVNIHNKEEFETDGNGLSF